MIRRLTAPYPTPSSTCAATVGALASPAGYRQPRGGRRRRSLRDERPSAPQRNPPGEGELGGPTGQPIPAAQSPAIRLERAPAHHVLGVGDHRPQPEPHLAQPRLHGSIREPQVVAMGHLGALYLRRAAAQIEPVMDQLQLPGMPRCPAPGSIGIVRGEPRQGRVRERAVNARRRQLTLTDAQRRPQAGGSTSEEVDRPSWRAPGSRLGGEGASRPTARRRMQPPPPPCRSRRHHCSGTVQPIETPRVDGAIEVGRSHRSRRFPGCECCQATTRRPTNVPTAAPMTTSLTQCLLS